MKIPKVINGNFTRFSTKIKPVKDKMAAMNKMIGKMRVNPISCPIKMPPNKVMINKANKPNPFVSIG